MRNSKAFQTSRSKRIQYHQTSFTTNVEGTYIVKKYMRRKRSTKSNPKIKKMTTGTYISIITLNANRLKAPIQRHQLAQWIQKQDPYLSCCLQETQFRPKDTYILKVRWWRNIFHANGKQKKAGVEILISDKIDWYEDYIKEDYKR